MKLTPVRLTFLLTLTLLPLAASAQAAVAIQPGDVRAVPGAMDVPFPVLLSNAYSVAGIQLELTYHPTLVFRGIQPTPRMRGPTFVVNDNTPGVLRIAALAQDQIPAGEGEIFNIIFDVDAAAPAGTFPVALSNVVAADIGTASLAIEVADGVFSVVAPYNITFLPPISLREEFMLQEGATLPLKFGVSDATGFVVDTRVKVRIFNLSLGIDKTYTTGGSGDDFVRIQQSEEHYLTTIHTNLLGMPVGLYTIEVTFDNFQKAQIGFELVEKGQGRGR